MMSMETTGTIPGNLLTDQGEKPTALQVTRAATLTDKAVCVQIELHGIGCRRTVSTSQIEVTGDADKATDKTLLAASKKLFVSPEYDRLKKLDGRIRQYVYAQAIQSGLSSGFYWLPIPAVQRVHEKLKEFRAERQKIIDEWTTPLEGETQSPYEKEIDAIQPKLGPLFNRGDYLSVDRVRKMHWFEWSYVSFGAPEKLKSISIEMYQAAQDQAARKVEQAAELAQQVLRANMLKLVEHLTDKLSGRTEDGKRKAFRTESVDKVKTFLTEFRERNITDDAELGALVEDAKLLIAGVDPETLRKDDRTRDLVAEGFSQIQARLDTMVVDRPRRAISFKDEE
jgi:hypothetical protein